MVWREINRWSPAEDSQRKIKPYMGDNTRCWLNGVIDTHMVNAAGRTSEMLSSSFRGDTSCCRIPWLRRHQPAFYWLRMRLGLTLRCQGDGAFLLHSTKLCFFQDPGHAVRAPAWFYFNIEKCFHDVASSVGPACQYLSYGEYAARL